MIAVIHVILECSNRSGIRPLTLFYFVCRFPSTFSIYKIRTMTTCFYMLIDIVN